MISHTKAFVATIAMLWTCAAPAATLTDTYTGLAIFGDSLSDTGQVFAATGGTFPSPPYFNGRFSNGPVWADQIADDFANAGKATVNVAFGGAKAVDDADSSPDLLLQVSLFGSSGAVGLLGPRPLGVVFIGGNDLLAAARANNPQQIARAAAQTVRSQVSVLAGLGLKDIVLVNSIDVAATPRITLEGDGDPIAASRATAAFNDVLSRGIVAQPALFNDVTLFDFAQVSADLFADPAAAGLTDVTNACLSNPGPCLGLGRADEFLFWDSVHPSAAAHSIIAEAFRAGATSSSLVVAPVPLPAGAWSLLAGLAMLGALGASRSTRTRSAT